MKFISFLLSLILFYSCRMNETKSDNHSFFILINDTLINDSIDIIKGRKELLKIENKNIWKIELDGVRGGYSELFGNKFNETDGDKAKRIFLYSKNNIVNSLSYEALKKLDFTTVDSIRVYLIN